MPRMIELIRQSAVPANLMRSAARGALSLPAVEMLEVLVYLARHPLFSEQAALTLAGWDEASMTPVLSDPEAPPEILEYFLAPENRRLGLLPVLLENRAVSETQIVDMACSASRETLGVILGSERVRSTAEVLQTLLANPDVDQEQTRVIRGELDRMEAGGQAGPRLPQPDGVETAETDQVESEFEEDADVLGSELSAYLSEHEAEIAAAENAPFHLIGPSADEQEEIAAAPVSHASGLAARALAMKPKERITPIQKISRLSVGERVQLALKGNREERMILVRDGVKVVSNAVLCSPRLNEADVELFASMRNVGENVLRGISGNRKFMKRYAVKRLLTANPRCPIEVALPLVKELLVSDLQQLSTNKNVSDTVRRFAWKTLRTKSANRDR